MAPFPKTLKDYINVAALRAYTKTVEAEYEMLTHISQIVIDVENEIYILENVIFRGEYSK